MMNYKYECGTDIGLQRQKNQDNLASYPDLGLFIVADGMGGHLGGETASQMAVDIIADHVRNAQKKKNWSAKETLIEAVSGANQAIYERSQKEARLHGMGTTATALLFHNNLLTIGHVGDSRCYFIRPQALWQITRDHSLVEEKRRAGIITREEMKTDSMRNVITRSVGFEPDLEVDLYEMDVVDGDFFLVCSDGLSGPVKNDDILRMIQQKAIEEKDFKVAIGQLIEAANEKGGDDNITVVLVQVTGETPELAENG